MKKILIFFSLCLVVVSIIGCNKTESSSVFDEITNSPAARMELPDGRVTYIDGELDSLKTCATLCIMESPMEPSDNEEDWLYRIVFNPSDRIKNRSEIVVSFHKNYVQINQEYYIAGENVSYEDILEQWVKPKFKMFMGDS